MGENFYLYQLAFRSADVIVSNEPRNLRHLSQWQLAGGNNDIGEASIVAYRLDIRDIALCGDMHLHSYLISVSDDSHIGSDDGTDTRLFGSMQQGMHFLYLVIINDGIDGEVGTHTSSGSSPADLDEVVDSKIRCRTGTHIQLSHTKIDGVGSSLNGCL